MPSGIREEEKGHFLSDYTVINFQYAVNCPSLLTGAEHTAYLPILSKEYFFFFFRKKNICFVSTPPHLN